jgi:N-acetylmuramoyl-L-alanine amidase
MSETSPREQAYWGESVYGVGAVPDSLEVRGVYSGFLIVPESLRVTDSPIVYHLAPPDLNTLAQALDGFPLRYSFDQAFRWIENCDSATVHDTSGFGVSLNPPDYPFTIRFRDSVQVIRHGPRQGYFSISQPRGVEALVVGREGDWYRARLSATQFAWVDTLAVERLAGGIVPPKSFVRSVRTYSDSQVLRLEIPLSGRHPFRVYEDDARTIRLQIFGVTTDTDRIRYDFTDSLLKIATWSQPEDGLYELRMALTQDIWGYDVRYEGNTLFLELVRPPVRVRSIRGKTIVIDPGHSPDPGAVGPTGYTEAEANLGIALEVEKELLRKGARPVLTRRDSSPLPLDERPVIAGMHDADLFVSIHNNALPDGVNPLTNHGTSSYYYHPHSMELARTIHREMVAATEQPDHGLYHGNLAVSRPTQYPAVLVECAFQILPEDEAKLKTEEFRRTVARAIVRGIESFLESYNNGHTE